MTDILDARRNSSDFCWILKDYESKISYFNNYKSKEIIRKALLTSLQFKYDITLLSDKTGKPEDELLKEAENILTNMSHNIGMNSIRFMGVTLSKIMKKLYTHVFVNENGVAKMREALADSNTVLLPTHRSYADFLLVSYVMFYYNLPMPVIAAAMDFMNMKFVGELLRSCGAFFIRRSFVDDDLYWSVFSHYIKTLISMSQESLEFFIEGTRSRTNKSLYPKIGMLGIILEMWLSSNCDIKIIPIGISYDRLLEEKLYAWELFGVPKPKESTSGLLKVRHILSENFGNVYFNIGDPISLSELAGQFHVARLDHNLQLRFRPTLFESEKNFLRQLSLIIVENQQRNCVISDWSVIVTILMNDAASRSRSLPIVDLLRLYQAMTLWLSSLDVKVAAGSNEELLSSSDAVAMQRIEDALVVHHQLVRHDHQGVALVTYPYASTPTYDESQTTAVIVDRIHLGMYRNPILFHLAKESLLLNRIKFGDRQGIFADFSDALQLLSREFIFAGSVEENYDKTVSKLRRTGLLSGQDLAVNMGHACLCVIEGAVSLHLVAYIIYGHAFLRSVVPGVPSMAPSDQVKMMQKTSVELCRTDPWMGQRYLEVCSLDIARNALSQMTDIHRRQSLDSVRKMVTSLNNFICVETRLRLQGLLERVTPG